MYIIPQMKVAIYARVSKEVFGLLGIKSASVLTLMTICFNGHLSFTPGCRYTSYKEMQPLVKALLDAGVPVDCYWRDLDYSILDPRLGKGTIR